MKRGNFNVQHINLTFTENVSCCIWPPQDDVSRNLALVRNDETIYGAMRHKVLLKGRGCLPCYTEEVLRMAKRESKITFIVHII